MSQTSLRLRVVPRYPAHITATDGIAVVRDGVDVLIKSDYGSLVQVPAVTNPDRTFFLAWDQDIDNYNAMSLTNIIENIQDAVIGPTLAAIDAAAPGADQVVYFTDPDTAATYTVSDFVRSISNVADGESFMEAVGGVYGGVPYYNRLDFDSLSSFDSMTSSLSAAVYNNEVTSSDAEEITNAVNNILSDMATVGGTITFPAGSYYFDAQYGQSLNLSTYAYGDAALNAALVVPYGTCMRSAGMTTQFCFINLDEASSVGIAIAEDGSTGAGFSQKAFTSDGFMIRAIGGVGRYGVLAPKNADLFSRKRPKYQLDRVHFAGATENKTVLQSPNEGWDVGVMIGDTFGYDGKITGQGTFLATTDPSAQHQMTGFKCSAAYGAFGLHPVMIMKSVYTGIDMSDGVEGFALQNSEIWDSYYGVITSNAAVEPGGFIDNVHTNTVRGGFKFKNRAMLHVGKVECYRGDGYYTDGTTPWYGMDCQASEVDVEYLAIGSGDSYAAEVNSAGLHADSTSPVTITGWRARSVYNLCILDGSPDCKIGDGHVTNVNTIFNLKNGASDIQGGEVRVRSVTPTNYFVTDGTVTKARLRFPSNTLMQPRIHSELAPAAAATLTVKPRLSASDYQIAPTAGAGAYNYDVILDHASAIDGDVVEIKVVVPISTNPTVRICSNSTSTILATLVSTGTSVRYVCRFVYSDTNSLWRGTVASTTI